MASCFSSALCLSHAGDRAKTSPARAAAIKTAVETGKDMDTSIYDDYPEDGYLGGEPEQEGMEE